MPDSTVHMGACRGASEPEGRTAIPFRRNDFSQDPGPAGGADSARAGGGAEFYGVAQRVAGYLDALGPVARRCWYQPSQSTSASTTAAKNATSGPASRPTTPTPASRMATVSTYARARSVIATSGQ